MGGQKTINTMKKIFLFFVVALLVGCTDYTDDFNAIDERLDKLEEALPSIEEQIESINTQLASLKETDNAIKAQIAELEKGDKATATEIANLKSKDSELEKSISDLQKYVDTQIANAKSEAAAAYATIEQYNNIVSQLSAVQSSTNKLSEELTAKINAEVKNLTDKITDLENRIKAVEEKIENLMVRIQSVSYMPEYADGKVLIERKDSVSSGILSFRISPKDAVAELAKVWESAVSCEAYYPKTRAVSLIKLAVTEFVGDAENGIATVKVSGEGLSDEFFAGTQEAKIALVISDGNNQVVSDYADAYGQDNFGKQPAEIYVSPATITTTFEGTHESLQITSNADWIVSCEQTDVILSARVGRGNGTVDVEIPAATAARNFVIKFIASKMMTVAGITISTTQEFDVQVSQNATGTDLNDYAYYEDCGEDVEKNIDGYWPYIDAFEGWNPQGDAAANVAYKGSNASVRASGTNYQPTADAVGISGQPYMFLNKVPASAYFVIENIAVTGGSNYIFTFNVSCQNGYNSGGPLFATVDGSLIHLELGYDGVNWDAVDCTYTPNGGNGWYAVLTEFKVAADATKLYARFTYEAPASNGGGRFDDFKLVEGGNGSELNFGAASTQVIPLSTTY